MRNKHLSLEERDKITILRGEGLSIRKIANILDRSPSTISREIRRGITLNGTYFAESTERLIRQRKLNDRRKRKMNNPEIYNYVLEKLKDKLSPRIIQNDIKRDLDIDIEKDAIYDFIYRYNKKIDYANS